jgi:hypothetical protein
MRIQEKNKESWTQVYSQQNYTAIRKNGGCEAHAQQE